MQGVEINGLDAVLENFDSFLSEESERRRAFHARCGARLEEEVGQEVSLRVQDSRGRVRQWQRATVGTGGGYVAVRPLRGETGADSPGAITNYLENGHRIRNSESRARAFLFYAAARSRAKSIALEEAEAFAEELAGMLE